jgi:hypothetical protein
MHCLEESKSDILCRELRQLAQRSESTKNKLVFIVLVEKIIFLGHNRAFCKL